MKRWSSRKSKTYGKFMDGVNETEPLEGRKYTMTHSDETGDLFVSIGLQFDEDAVGPIRDEVRLSWEMMGNTPVLYGEVLIDGEGVDGNAAIRNAIFIKEMPTALKAIREADAVFFEEDSTRDQVPIFIKFNSEKEKYNKLRYFDIMAKYK